MDWEGDPDLKAMREEFVASFADRAASLRAQIVILGKDTPAAAAQIRHVAHKLAGAAESYEFATLTRIGAALDDLISQLGITDPALLAPSAALLAEALDESIRTRKDPAKYLDDSRFAKLISAAESPASGARS